MRTSAMNVEEALESLSTLTLFELRGEWRRLHRMSPPMRLSRDLLLRGILYKLQERAFGGLAKAVARKLEQGGVASSDQAEPRIAPPIALKPGTRLVREWRGETHVALIQADGVEWRGRRYPSLSVVAREITGAHWSGPRFFGLRRRRSVPVSGSFTFAGADGHGEA
ncbi:DUF2924 domain-containing protein [Methylocystis sp.]|uniref:DUF2924 domain-containing protein n=1 Tax=Methylocystis sp. TaxID=1911079 RepID=UPI003DA50D0D